MWIKHVILGLCGLASGSAVAAGTFAFLIMLKIIPRMLGKSRTASNILLYENMIILGGAAGNIASTFLNISLPFGHVFLGLYGICAGLFVGCIAVALAEILQTFPVIFRRLGLKNGLWVILLCMSLGKMTGAFYYFFNHMAAK